MRSSFLVGYRQMRRAVALGVAFVACLGPVRAQEQETIGHLLEQIRDANGQWRQRTAPYTPREGDMVFFNDHSKKWGILYTLVGSEAPYHVGLIFKQPDGRCA